MEVSSIPSKESEFFKSDLSSFKSLIFKKLTISSIWPSESSQPLVKAPESSLRPLPNNSFTALKPKRDFLSIDLEICWILFLLVIFKLLVINPCIIFKLVMFNLNSFFLNPIWQKISAIKLQISYQLVLDLIFQEYQNYFKILSCIDSVFPAPYIPFYNFKRYLVNLYN